MPNSALPGNTYMGDGQRTTAEMQDALDQVATWLNAAQAELDALTGTTFGEAAVRGVGAGADDVPDTEILDARLGTSGDLGSIATESAGDYLSSGTVPAIIWDETPTDVLTQTDLGNPGAGLYLVKVSTYSAGNRQAVLYWDGASSVTGIAHHGTELRGSTPRSLATYVVGIGSTGIVTSERITYDANGDDGIGSFDADIVEVRKF